MKFLLLVFLLVFSMSVMAQDAGVLSKTDTFFKEYAWIVLGLVMVFEYLVGVSKVKSNSTIEMVLGFLKKLFKGK